MSAGASLELTIVCYTAHHEDFWRLPPDEMRRMQEEMPHCRWMFPMDERELIRHIPFADVYFGWAIPPGAWERAVRLRWIHTPQVGTGRLGRLPGIERVRLTNSARLDREPVPHLAITLFLSLLFGIPEAVRLHDRSQWRPAVFAQRVRDGKMRLLSGMTVTIVGSGGIGGVLADWLRPMCNRIQVVRRRKDLHGKDPVFLLNEWRTFLPDTDVLFLAIPVDTDTRGFLDKEKIDSIRRPAYIVNVGRGGLVVEKDVVAGLADGRLAGYAADVASPEPLPEDSPLWRSPNTLLTPHIGAMRPDFWRRQVDLFLSLFPEFMNGGSPGSGIPDRSS